MSSPHEKRTYDDREDYLKHLEKRLHDLEQFKEFMLEYVPYDSDNFERKPGLIQTIGSMYNKWLREK